MFQRSPRQSVSPYKSHTKNPKKINQPLTICSSPLARFLPSNFQETGMLQSPPPFLPHSYPPFPRQPPPQPPLLPLPTAHPRRRAATSCPPTNKKTNNNNRTRDSSLTPKRPNSSNNPKKENIHYSTKKLSDCVINPSDIHLGPDLNNNLPNTVKKVLPLISPGNIISDDHSNVESNNSDKFSGSVVFAISPPPSSLPLPRFSLSRPNISCKVEAARIDTAATDDLRRILRLR